MTRHSTVASLLSSLRLSSYAARFDEEGHDDVSYLAAIAAGRYPLLKLSDVFADVGLSSPADQEAVRAALLASRPAEPPSPPPPDTSPPAAGTTLVTKQAEGLTLVLNEGSSTGYKGVRPKGDRFMAEIWEDGRNVSLGRYDTAVEAAVAYARHAAPKGGARRGRGARGATARRRRRVRARRRRRPWQGGGAAQRGEAGEVGARDRAPPERGVLDRVQGRLPGAQQPLRGARGEEEAVPRHLRHGGGGGGGVRAAHALAADEGGGRVAARPQVGGEARAPRV